MARSQSPGDLQDFWKEFEDIESSTKENDGEEEETAKTPDEGELEAQWLQEAGYGFLVRKYQAGKELTDDEIQALTSSLPRNHAVVVKKRVDTLNATLRRKQKYTTKIDVRNIFPQQRTAEPVVIHSQVVEEPDEKPKQISSTSTRAKPKSFDQLQSLPNTQRRQPTLRDSSSLSPVPVRDHSDFSPVPVWDSFGFSPVSVRSSGFSPVPVRESCGFSPVPVRDSFDFSTVPVRSSGFSPVLMRDGSGYSGIPLGHNKRNSSEFRPISARDSSDSSLSQTLLAQSPNGNFGKTDHECAFEEMLVGLKISRSDSQGSDSLLTSPSRSKSSSCDTLDSIDSGLDSSSSNLNKEQSSSKDSLECPTSPKVSFPYQEGAQNSPIITGKASSYFGQGLMGASKGLNSGCNNQSTVENPEGPKSPKPPSSNPWPLTISSRKRKHKQTKAPKSPVSPRNEVIHPEFGTRQNRGSSKGAGPFAKNKGGYSMSGMTEEVQDNAELGVEMLSLQQQRETHNKRNSQLSPISDSDITFEFSIEENGKDFNSHSSWPATSNHNLPNFSLVKDKLGLTRIQDISDSDLVYVRKQSLLELTHMFDNHNISYTRRRSKKRYKEHGLFGVPLQVMLEHDQRLVPDTKLPIVFSEVMKYLVKNCLDTEGILRIPGLFSRVKHLRGELEEKLYQGTFIWSEDLTPNDVAALMKQLLRELPVPLLTDEYIDAFAQVENLPDRKQQLHALNLLILLLPNVHRDTLYDLLVFLELVIDHSSTNRMSLHNVAMIMAPNLFMAPKVRNTNPNKDNKQAWDLEIKMAAGTSNIMKMLIKYRHILWTIPSYLISLVRRQYELETLRRNKEKTRMKFLAKKDKAEVYKKPNIKHENDFQEGVVRVQAPHLTKSSTAIQLDENMTAGDIVSKFRVIQGSQTLDPRRLTQSLKSNQPQVFADPRTFLSAGDDTFLYEKGGNIGERCLPNDTNMMALYKVNPNAEWIIQRRDGS